MLTAELLARADAALEGLGRPLVDSNPAPPPEEEEPPVRSPPLQPYSPLGSQKERIPPSQLDLFSPGSQEG